MPDLPYEPSQADPSSPDPDSPDFTRTRDDVTEPVMSFAEFASTQVDRIEELLNPSAEVFEIPDLAEPAVLAVEEQDIVKLGLVELGLMSPGEARDARELPESADLLDWVPEWADLSDRREGKTPTGFVKDRLETGGYVASSTKPAPTYDLKMGKVIESFDYSKTVSIPWGGATSIRVKDDVCVYLGPNEGDMVAFQDYHSDLIWTLIREAPIFAKSDIPEPCESKMEAALKASYLIRADKDKIATLHEMAKLDGLSTNAYLNKLIDEEVTCRTRELAEAGHEMVKDEWNHIRIRGHMVFDMPDAENADVDDAKLAVMGGQIEMVLEAHGMIDPHVRWSAYPALDALVNSTFSTGPLGDPWSSPSSDPLGDVLAVAAATKAGKPIQSIFKTGPVVDTVGLYHFGDDAIYIGVLEMLVKEGKATIDDIRPMMMKLGYSFTPYMADKWKEAREHDPPF